MTWPEHSARVLAATSNKLVTRRHKKQQQTGSQCIKDTGAA